MFENLMLFIALGMIFYIVTMTNNDGYVTKEVDKNYQECMVENMFGGRDGQK